MTNEELCILAQKGNTDAENELILNLLPSLKALAARFEAQYSGLPIEKDDLLQEGTIGFLRAVHSFRLEKGNLSKPTHRGFPKTPCWTTSGNAHPLFRPQVKC